ncbi:MAG: InlB B-repeat-containing protein [Treponema sp.]|nr:InlB B-repeat-containing protein [Treponema sp.]
MNKKRLWIRIRLFSLLFLAFSFLGCEFFNFNGDIKESVFSNLQVVYSFYEIANPNTDHVDLTFQVGQMVPSTSFPQFTQEESLLVGWRFLKYTNVDVPIVPDGLYYGDRNMITAINVGAAPLSFYAVWAKKRYVNFVTNCDTQLESIIVPDGYSIPNPSAYYNLTKEKHAFRGWYTDAECTQPFNITENIVTSDLTLYAKWVLQVTLTLDPNDGTGKTVSDTFDVGESYQLPDYLYDVPAGKGFVGWAGTPDATTAEYLYSDTISSVDQDMTLYSVWSTNIATIVYHDNAGLNQTYTVNKYGVGARVGIGRYREYDVNTEKTYERYLRDLWHVNGQTINGFGATTTATMSDAGSYSTYTYIEITGSMDLYAIWGIKVYGIEFMMTNPATSGRAQFYRTDVNWGEKVTPPEEVPYAPGYVFTGWYWYKNGQELLFDFDMILNEENIGNEGSWLMLEARFTAGTSIQNTFYVGGNDNIVRNGTIDNPYTSITEALNAINAAANASIDYKIILKNDAVSYRDNVYISTFYGNSLTIKFIHDTWNMSIYPKLDSYGNTVTSPIITIGVPQRVSIEHLEFRNANSTLDGGAIRVLSGSNVVLKDCRFCSNSSDGNGGAIYIENGASVTIENIEYSYGNNCNEQGGFIYNGGNLVLTGKIRNDYFGTKNGDIYLASGKVVTVAAGFNADDSSNLYIGIASTDYVDGTQVLDIAAAAPAASYQRFRMTNSSWNIDSNGLISTY